MRKIEVEYQCQIGNTTKLFVDPESLEENITLIVQNNLTMSRGRFYKCPTCPEGRKGRFTKKCTFKLVPEKPPEERSEEEQARVLKNSFQTDICPVCGNMIDSVYVQFVTGGENITGVTHFFVFNYTKMVFGTWRTVHQSFSTKCELSEIQIKQLQTPKEG